MKNKKTMIVKVDWDKLKVLNENLDFIVSNFIKMNADFELVLIDAENYVIDSNLNTIVNQYISDCKKTNKPLAVDCKLTSEFIVKLMGYIKEETMGSSNASKQGKTTIEIFITQERSFRANIPNEFFDEEMKENFLALGVDRIMGGLPKEIIFDYVLIPFYWFLYKNDLLNDKEYGDLRNYNFGLS